MMTDAMNSMMSMGMLGGVLLIAPLVALIVLVVQAISGGGADRRD